MGPGRVACRPTSAARPDIAATAAFNVQGPFVLVSRPVCNRRTAENDTGQTAMVKFWRGFITGLQDGQRHFFALVVGVVKGAHRVCRVIRAR
jgi:hypothetical protein